MKLNDLLAGTQSLANTKTAPYQEVDAVAAVSEWLNQLNIQNETDKYGNLMCRVRKGMPRRTVAFITHLDRPALRATSVKAAAVQVNAEGPIPGNGFKSAKLVFPKTKEGEIKATVGSSKGNGRTESASLKAPAKGPFPEAGDFATFDIEGFSRKENKLKGGGLSVGTSVAAIIAALADLSDGSSPVDAYAVFTRSRHADAGGAVALSVDFPMPRDTILLAVDAVPENGEVKRGGGPVVLMGDTQGPFDPRATAVLLGAAAEIKGKKFDYQRGAALDSQLLPSVFLAFGFSAGGVAIPTANHLCFGPRGVAPEEQDLRDVQNVVELCCGAAVRASAGGDDLEQRRNGLIMSSSEGRDRLREPIDPVTGYPTGARF
ncbi:MAG: hypothetical protein AAFX94_01460 [Myxococcota bacterium]